MKELLIATNNRDKLREIISLLPKNLFKIKSLLDFPEILKTVEDQSTLEGNSIKKAKEAFESSKMLTMSDDTGLEVYYLNLSPGVYSARYAGENATYNDNVQKLLNELKGVPPRRRFARFRTSIAIIGNGIIKTCEGSVEGQIMETPKGTNGFGYDSIFIPKGSNKTYAEMDLSEKNIYSHRAKAFFKLLEILKQI
ncbi:MAG: RdgB/HAM1 family non-canonical purine NTP pyrophosphatase [Ignavibacteria bacterium]|nr:RdgB/HAM1 family non-canonical purine NTP pyrophosphatase [Bacteroidota bacterium]MSQ45888.1 RdgB/HAM1 family non-canonical purine NTP pyrophosphatase [Ignavibacteria bacterium]